MNARSLSWWEHDSWVNGIDLIVIGSGIVGLNAAWQFKKDRPGARVVVLERGVLPTGASTRNAGFACFGSVSELLENMESGGEEKTFSLVRERLDGLKLLRSNLGDEAIGYEGLGDSEIFTEDDRDSYEKCADAIPWLNERLETITGLKETFTVRNDLISSFGFANVAGLIYCPVEGQVDSGRLMLELYNKANAAGVQVLTGAAVNKLDSTDGEVNLSLADGTVFNAKHVILATNAFTPQFLPDIDIKPARGQVLITRPIPGLKVKGIFHYDQGYYYFRNVGERILLGGARNLDFQAEETYDMSVSDKIQKSLKQLLRNVIIPGIPFETEMQWAGIMAMGSEKYYILEKVRPNIVVAARLSGMGVALGSKVGADAARLALAED